MAKMKTIYVCQSCGYQCLKWHGRCPDCNSWNTLVEEKAIQNKKISHIIKGEAYPSPISKLDITESYRLVTEMGELDRVLGGGIVPGSAILLGGDPGIGKSTLILQAMGNLAERGRRVLYISGEESMRQLKLRGERIAVVSENLYIYAETVLERILKTLDAIKPDVVVIDSIQSIYSDSLESAPGSVSQVRESATELIQHSKSREIPLFLVGHVTKEGFIAGPRLLEHMVDTVLYLEGEKGYAFRILRTVKNRFGSIMEVGIFEMEERGLTEVNNPSRIFLDERPGGSSGSVVVSSVEGTRPIMVEIQSLVSPTVFGMPRRTVVGVDQNRVAIMLAILEKKAGLNLSNHDVFLKVAGGIRLDEPAVDMGIAISVASNFIDKAIDSRTFVFGEIGLAGEIRSVSRVEQRIKEGKALGFNRCIIPKNNVKGIKIDEINVMEVSSITEAINELL